MINFITVIGFGTEFGMIVLFAKTNTDKTIFSIDFKTIFSVRLQFSAIQVLPRKVAQQHPSRYLAYNICKNILYAYNANDFTNASACFRL